MSNYADLLKDVDAKNVDPTAVIGDVIGTLADFAGGIGAIISVASLVGSLLGGGDNSAQEIATELSNLEQTITTDFQQMNAGQAAQNIINRVTDQGNQLAAAQTVFMDLQNLLSLQQAGQLTPADVDTKIELCITAINALAPEGNWDVVYSQQVWWTDAGTYIYLGRDAGYGQQAPDASQGNEDIVFNYTYILPNYLNALSWFLAVAIVLDPDFASHYGNVITGAAALLLEQHNAIQAGIRQLQPSNFLGGLQSIVTPPGPSGFIVGGISAAPGSPQTANIEYGAVEVFSGASAMADYILPISEALDSQGNILAGIVPKFQIRVLREAKDLYAAVGLSSLWTTINNLNRMVGGELMSGPNFGDWSFRTDLFPTSKIAPQQDGNFHVRDLVNFLTNTAPNDTPPGPTFTTSLRALLSPATTSQLTGSD